MMIPRRTFLVGLAAVLATPALSKVQEKFIGPIAKGILRPGQHFRRIVDMTFSTMAEAGERVPESPVRWTFYRDDEVFYSVMMNWRATLRWVAVPDADIIIGENSLLRVAVEPCHTWAAIHLLSNVERDRTKPPRFYSENFRWQNGELELDAITRLDPLPDPGRFDDPNPQT